MREEKKRKLEDKKKRQHEAAKRRRAEDDSSNDEDNPAPVNLCDDSSEYSDELAEELEPDADSYPYVQKEPEVRDFLELIIK